MCNEHIDKLWTYDLNIKCICNFYKVLFSKVFTIY